MLAFENSTVSGEASDGQAKFMLVPRLSEALTIPVLDRWQVPFWEVGQAEGLIGELAVGSDCQEGYFVRLSETGWKDVVISLLNGNRIPISND